MCVEAWIDVIVDRVDLFIPEKNLIIESDGAFHLNNGHVTQCTALKTYLLQKNGYHVVRLDYRRFDHRWKEYLKSQLNDFFTFD